MRVHITDYTPKGAKLSECSTPDLLRTVEAIYSHGMLRMHATARMMEQVVGEINERGYGYYEYSDLNEWEESVGIRYAIAKSGESSKDEDHHECIACELEGELEGEFEVFEIGGALTQEVKDRISTKMGILVADARKRQAEWAAEQAKNPPKTYSITGVCPPPTNMWGLW